MRVPSPEDMLLHLAVYCAIHGCTAGKWLEDLRRWRHAHDQVLDWDRLVTTAGAWRLALPLRQGIAAARRRDR